MERNELLERLKLAHRECRAEVTLGWERQKLFLTLNPAITIALFALAKHRGAFAAAAFLALAGALIAQKSHARYRAARGSLQRIEDELGIADLQTTGGQRVVRGQARNESLRIVDVVTAVFLLTAVIDVLLAWWV